MTPVRRQSEATAGRGAPASYHSSYGWMGIGLPFSFQHYSRDVTEQLRQQAIRHRLRLADVPFVAITGSCGKTTTKDLAAAILSGWYGGRAPDRSGPSSPVAGVVSRGSDNCGDTVAANVLKVAPSHRYFVQELGAWGSGTLDPALTVVRPTVGVVLNIRRDHLSSFHGLANTQMEKAKVVTTLPALGTAILNADDPRVAEMAGWTQARVVTFGQGPGADFRASDVSARWPDRLTFELSAGGVRRRVATRLLGEHLLGSALAALTIAVTLGVPIDEAIRRVGTVEPPSRRMSPVVLPDGVTFIRDDFKAPSDSLEEAFAFLAKARATRRIAVLGRISDYPGRSRMTYTAAALSARAALDEVVFVGQRAFDLWQRDAASAPPPAAGVRAGTLTVHRTVREASRDLNGRLRSGDLVLLKGSGPADHLERILFDHVGEVGCWLTDCGRVISCDDCDLLTTRSDVVAEQFAGVPMGLR